MPAITPLVFSFIALNYLRLVLFFKNNLKIVIQFDGLEMIQCVVSLKWFRKSQKNKNG